METLRASTLLLVATTCCSLSLRQSSRELPEGITFSDSRVAPSHAPSELLEEDILSENKLEPSDEDYYDYYRAETDHEDYYDDLTAGGEETTESYYYYNDEDQLATDSKNYYDYYEGNDRDYEYYEDDFYNDDRNNTDSKNGTIRVMEQPSSSLVSSSDQELTGLTQSATKEEMAEKANYIRAKTQINTQNNIIENVKNSEAFQQPSKPTKF